MFGFSYPGQTYPAGFPFVLPSDGPPVVDVVVATARQVNVLGATAAVRVRATVGKNPTRNARKD